MSTTTTHETISAAEIRGMTNLAQAIVRTLDAVTRPVLAPFQRFIPSLGGVDISPVVAIIVIQAASRYLLPWLLRPLQALIG